MQLCLFRVARNARTHFTLQVLTFDKCPYATVRASVTCSEPVKFSRSRLRNVPFLSREVWLVNQTRMDVYVSK